MLAITDNLYAKKLQKVFSAGHYVDLRELSHYVIIFCLFSVVICKDNVVYIKEDNNSVLNYAARLVRDCSKA